MCRHFRNQASRGNGFFCRGCTMVARRQRRGGEDVATGTEDQRKIGWHWVWFLPYCLLVLLVVERHTVSYALTLLSLGYKRWLWVALLSPSAYFCLSVMLASITSPLYGLWFMAVAI